LTLKPRVKDAHVAEPRPEAANADHHTEKRENARDDGAKAGEGESGTGGSARGRAEAEGVEEDAEAIDDLVQVQGAHFQGQGEEDGEDDGHGAEKCAEEKGWPSSV
jgi:hypothetical protein